MKRNIVAVLTIVGVAAGVGWNVASHPESSAGLQEISLTQGSEHSHPGATAALARVRVRVSPSELGLETRAAADGVPRVSLAAE